MFIILIIKVLLNLLKFVIGFWNILTPLPPFGHSTGMSTQLAINLLSPLLEKIPRQIGEWTGLLSFLHGMVHLFMPFIGIFSAFDGIRDATSTLMYEYPVIYTNALGLLDDYIYPMLRYTDGSVSLSQSGTNELIVELVYYAITVVVKLISPVLEMSNFAIHVIQEFV